RRPDPARAVARAHRLHGRGAGARTRADGAAHPGRLGRTRADRAAGLAGVSILVDKSTRLLVQGLTGSEGRFHGLRNRAYGTNVVAGVTPGKGGQEVEGIPVFDAVQAAVEATGADTSLVFVPARFAAAELAQLGLGNSTIVGIGGDPIVGSSFIDVLERFEADPETEIVVLVGEIGGDEEEKAARFVAERMTKPVYAYIAGFSAPPGKTMGHAGAIISGSSGTAQAKKEALEAAGI